MILWGMKINNLLKFARYEIQYWTTIPSAPLCSRKYYFETLRFVIKFPSKNHFLFFCYIIFLVYFYLILSYKCKRKFFNWIPLPVLFLIHSSLNHFWPMFPFYTLYLSHFMSRIYTFTCKKTKIPSQYIYLFKVNNENTKTIY